MKFVFICVLLALSTYSLAQEARYRHVVSIEYSNLSHTPGSGPFVGYDYLFGHTRHGFWNAGAEIGGSVYFSDEAHAYTIRTSAGYNLGKQHHFLQLGIGTAYYNTYYKYATGDYKNTREQFYYSGPLIGYRFISRKRFQFGASAGIYMSLGINTRNYYPVTVSVGWALGKR